MRFYKSFCKNLINMRRTRGFLQNFLQKPNKKHNKNNRFLQNFLQKTNNTLLVSGFDSKCENYTFIGIAAIDVVIDLTASMPLFSNQQTCIFFPS
jgi:hypothetical protein